MPAPRQQRGSAVRGTVQLPNAWPVRSLTLAILTRVANTLTLEIFGIAGKVSLSGVPQITRSDTGAAPTSAAFTAPHTLTLTYLTGLPAGLTYTIPSQDPALRTNTGQWLAATSLVNDDVPAPTFAFASAPQTISTAVTVWENAGSDGPLDLPAVAQIGFTVVVAAAAVAALGVTIQYTPTGFSLNIGADGSLELHWTGTDWST